MTRISFYLLKGELEQERQHFACRLVEKAFHQGHEVYIHTENQQQAETFNQLLWSFRADSFVPHQLISADTAEDCPVLIGYQDPPERLIHLMVNLSQQQPLFFSRFERLAELVNDQEEIKTQARTRYRFYQQRGYQLENYQI